MTKKVIDVSLYGGKSIFGGREQPLEAVVVSCDKSDSCSYYQSGECWAIRGISGTCKHGSVSTHKGYTSRAKKYHEFGNKWRNHESYNKLQRPSDKLGLIDGTVVFPYSFATIKKDDNGNYKVDRQPFFSSISYIEYDKFNVELIKQICNYKPQAMMGGEITDYQKKIVPLFLAHLKEVLPEKYEEFIANTKGFDKRIDYVGRKAYLTTIKPSFVKYNSSSYPEFNEEWYWDGEFLVFESGYVSKVNVTRDYEVETFIIRPTKKSIVKIINNDQVSEDTVFVD